MELVWCVARASGTQEAFPDTPGVSLGLGTSPLRPAVVDQTGLWSEVATRGKLGCTPT